MTVINCHNNLISNEKIYKCKHCEKSFTVRQYKWSHEQRCKLNLNENSELINYEIEKIKLEQIKEEQKLLELQIELQQKKKIKNTTNVTINNTNHGTINNINNNLIINNLGEETISKLTISEIKNLAKEDKNAIIYITDLLNFDEKNPENHNFCNTSLEGSYVSVYNKHTNKIEKVNKNEFYDKVLVNSIKKINEIIFKFDFLSNENKIDKKYIRKLENSINNKNLYSNKSKNVYKTNINQLSYNKKNIVLKTWNKLLKNDNNNLGDNNNSSEDENSSYDNSSDTD